MRMEIYRGIEFVRISSMPEEDQARIHQTLDKVKIIKILREQELLNDCILMTDYMEWATQARRLEHDTPEPGSVPVPDLRLAFK